MSFHGLIVYFLVLNNVCIIFDNKNLTKNKESKLIGAEATLLGNGESWCLIDYLRLAD